MPEKRPTRQIYVPPPKARELKQTAEIPSRRPGLLKKVEVERIENLTSRERYNDSYASHIPHERLLKDTGLILTYRRAILGNRHLFRDKVSKSGEQSQVISLTLAFRLTIIRYRLIFPDSARRELWFGHFVHVRGQSRGQTCLCHRCVACSAIGKTKCKKQQYEKDDHCEARRRG